MILRTDDVFATENVLSNNGFRVLESHWRTDTGMNQTSFGKAFRMEFPDWPGILCGILYLWDHGYSVRSDCMAGSSDPTDKSYLGRTVCRYWNHCDSVVRCGEMALTRLVINFKIMSDVFSVTETGKRCFQWTDFAVAFATDEIFGVSKSEGRISPWYNYGVMCVAIPGWTLGNTGRSCSGSLLPDFLVSALRGQSMECFCGDHSTGKEKSSRSWRSDRSDGCEYVICMVPVLNKVSTGFVIIITTLLVAGLATLFRPVEKKKQEESRQTDMKPNIYLYILVMAGVTYLIRMLPLVLFKREITLGPFCKILLYYVPYACLLQL